MAEWATTSWYERFKDFQSLVGFGGVILTLWWNAKLKRDEHERLIAHERKTLLAALRAELQANKNQYFRCLQQLKCKDAMFAYFVMNPSRQVFDSTTSKVGLLKPLQASGIIHAYRDLATLPQALKEAILLMRFARGSNFELPTTTGELLTIHESEFEEAIPFVESTVEALEMEIKALASA